MSLDSALLWMDYIRNVFPYFGVKLEHLCLVILSLFLTFVCPLLGTEYSFERLL